MKSFKQFHEDVRKMPGGGYGVYADKFVKGRELHYQVVNTRKN